MVFPNSIMWLKKKTGDAAEDLALVYLQQAGLTLVERNYRCRAGEIDLIMRHADSLVFVEVRFRKGNTYGGAAASVDRRKQRKLITAAQHYLLTLKPVPPCRFDIVGIGPEQRIEWLRNAFAAD